MPHLRDRYGRYRKRCLVRQWVTYQTRVTTYACFNWNAPMAGFLLIPVHVTIRAGLTEIVQRRR